MFMGEWLGIFIIIMSRYQHGYPWPFLATLLYRPLLPAGLQDYILYRHKAWCTSVLAGRPAFARPCEGVHRSTSLMSLSLLLQQCPAYLIRLTGIVFVMGVSGYTAAALWGAASRTCSILLAVFLCRCRQAYVLQNSVILSSSIEKQLSVYLDLFMIDFNAVSTHQGIFYVKKFGWSFVLF